MGAKQKRLFYHFYPSFPSRQKDFPVFTPLRRYRRSGYYQNIFQAIRSHCPPVRKAWETLFVCVDFRSANEAAKKIRRYRGSAFSPCHQSAHRNKMVASGLVGILPWGTLQKFGTYRIFARRDQFGARLSGQVPGQRCSPPDLFPPVFVFAGSIPAGTHTYNPYPGRFKGHYREDNYNPFRLWGLFVFLQHAGNFGAIRGLYDRWKGLSRDAKRCQVQQVRDWIKAVYTRNQTESAQARRTERPFAFGFILLDVIPTRFTPFWVRKLKYFHRIFSEDCKISQKRQFSRFGAIDFCFPILELNARFKILKKRKWDNW